MKFISTRFPDVATHVRQLLRLRQTINTIDPDRATPEDRIRLLHLEAEEEAVLSRIAEISQWELDAASAQQ